jgi:hypothetical protein
LVLYEPKGHKKVADMILRRAYRIIEAVQKGCPIETADLDANLRNRQKAIDEYMYGPANPNEPGNFWKGIAGVWDIPESQAKTMRCGNCSAFDVSDAMRACIERGMIGEDKAVDAMATIEKADLGYCNVLHFKCAGDRTCKAWLVGGAIDNRDRTK